MRIIAWMLTRMVLLRFFTILLSVAVFVLSLEVVGYSAEVFALRPGGFSIVPEYMITRSPVTLAAFLPISLLIALLLTITELSYRNELTAIWNAGVSPLRVVVMLLPMAFFVGALHFTLVDYAIPLVTPKLHKWGVGDYNSSKLKFNEKDPIWMRSGRDVVRVGAANANSTKLKNIIIFKRDKSGLLTEQIYAALATLEGGRWKLENTDTYYPAQLAPTHLDTMVYSGSIRPAAAGTRSGEPEEMSLQDISYFIKNNGFGLKPIWVYQTAWNKRLAQFFSGLVMIAMCIPLAVRFRRGGGMGSQFAAGVMFGFLYFVVDGLATTLGELGFVQPWLAAWFPVAAFTAFAASLTLAMERV
jgi:lipopolysaccharide export system permease protein